jgi:hypothetical protein
MPGPQSSLRRLHKLVCAAGHPRLPCLEQTKTWDGGVRDVYDRHGYEREDAAIMAAVARHVTAIVEGTVADNVVRLR